MELRNQLVSRNVTNTMTEKSLANGQLIVDTVKELQGIAESIENFKKLETPISKFIFLNANKAETPVYLPHGKLRSKMELNSEVTFSSYKFINKELYLSDSFVSSIASATEAYATLIEVALKKELELQNKLFNEL